MLGYVKEQTTLTREQKEAAGILSTATFLEYFDLMLYVHLAVLLNELFFPKYEPSVTSLLSAFTFCSTFIFRPLGAYIFGRIGDKLGRKSTVIMTTTLMALSCIVMANAPNLRANRLFCCCINHSLPCSPRYGIRRRDQMKRSGME